MGLGILLAAALPRLLLVGRHTIWVDEVFSLAMATGHGLEHRRFLADPTRGDYVEAPGPVAATTLSSYARHESPAADLSRVVRAVEMSDTSPPLYYLLLHAWTRAFGTGDAALRWFSLACALGCLPLLWATGRQLGGVRSAVSASVLFAVLPLSVFLSTEGRMYSLVWLAGTASLWATVRLSRRGPDVASIFVWWVGAVAGLLSHYFFLFAWLPACAWLLLFPGRTRRRTVGVLALAVGMTVAIWYVRLPAQMATWRLTDGWLKWPPPNYQPLKFYLHMPYHFFDPSGPWGSKLREDVAFAVVWVALAVAAAASRRGRGNSPSRRWLLPALSAAGVIGGVALVDLWKGTYAGAVGRYVSVGLPAAVLLAGLALGRLGPRLRAAFLVVIVLEGMVGLRRMRWNDGRNGQPLDEVARSLAKTAGPSDLVIVHSIPSGVVGFTRCFEAERSGAGPPGPAILSWVEQLGERRVPEDIERWVAGRTGVYLVRFHEVGADAPVESWLRGHAASSAKKQWESISVERFLPPFRPSAEIVPAATSGGGRP